MAIKAKRSVRNGHRKTLQRLYTELKGSDARVSRTKGPRRLPSEIRRIIAATKSTWLEQKTTRLRRRHAFHPLKSPADFYKRFSTKYANYTVYSLGGTSTDSQPKALASAMADGWKPITQQLPVPEGVAARYLQETWRPDTEARRRLQDIDRPITEEEVSTAIRRCKRDNQTVSPTTGIEITKKLSHHC